MTPRGGRDYPSPPGEDGPKGWRWRRDLIRDLRSLATALAAGAFPARFGQRKVAEFPTPRTPDGDGLTFVDGGILYVQLGGEWRKVTTTAI
jgi:hypothetical protein